MRTPINRDPSRIPPLAIPSDAPASKGPKAAKAAAKAPEAAKPQRAEPKVVADAAEFHPFISEKPAGVPERPNLLFRLATNEYTCGIILLAGSISFINHAAGVLTLGAGVANAFDVFGRTGRLVKRGIEGLAHAVHAEKPKAERKEPTIAEAGEPASKKLRRGTAEDKATGPRFAPAVEPEVQLPPGVEAQLHADIGAAVAEVAAERAADPAPAAEKTKRTRRAAKEVVELPVNGAVPFELELALRQAALDGALEPAPSEAPAASASPAPAETPVVARRVTEDTVRPRALTRAQFYGLTDSAAPASIPVRRVE